MAYLGLEIDEESIDYVNLLLNNLEKEDYKIMSISSANNGIFDNPNQNRFAFDIQIDFTHANHLFDTLYSYLIITKKEELNDLLKHSILIDQIFSNTNISTCIMKKNKGNMILDITKPNTSIKYNGDLENNIKSIKEKGKIICNRFDCTEESITNFIRCFYKDYNPSKIKRKENISYDLVNINTPNFLKEDEKVSSARKGTITHLCLQKLNEKEKRLQTFRLQPFFWWSGCHQR